MGIEGDANFRNALVHETTPRIDGNNYSTPRVSGDARNPTYTPLMLESWAGGTVDQQIATANFAKRSSPTPETFDVLYSNAIAGPFGDPVCGALSLLQNTRFFGGHFSNAVGGQVLNEGDQLWTSFYIYIPSSFCAGFSIGTTDPGPGNDGYGSTKLWRLGMDVDGDRITAQLSGFTRQACPVPDLYIDYVSDEIGGTGSKPFGGQATITRDSWHHIAMQYSLSTTAGFVRLWHNDEYIGQTEDFQTLTFDGDDIHNITIGDVYNGGSFADNLFYMDQFIFTLDTPNTVDEGGRPTINSQTRVSDFA